jgi:predicted Ser/Thr protein kinase
LTHSWNSTNDRLLKEAQSANQEWDVYKRKQQEDALDPEVVEFRKRRDAARKEACGESLGKTDAERTDAFKVCARRIGEDSAYGVIIKHPTKDIVFKTLNTSTGLTKYNAGSTAKAIRILDRRQAAENEAYHLQLLESYGVEAPRLLGFNKRKSVIQMEYLKDYDTYRTWAKKLPLAELKNINEQVVQQVWKMNRNMITHNDLHQGNIMYNPNTRKIKLIDFGLAESPRVGKTSIPEAVSVVPTEMREQIGRLFRHRRRAEDYAFNDLFHAEFHMLNKHRSMLQSLNRGDVQSVSRDYGSTAKAVDAWYQDLFKIRDYVETANTLKLPKDFKL